MLTFIKWLLGILLVLPLAFVGGAYYFFGGGSEYPDLTGAPLLPEGTIEAAVSFERPIGNVAVSSEGRVFFTLHPGARPEPPFLYEWVDGAARPFPAEGQTTLFQTPLGLSIDARGWLWVIDSGRHGRGRPRLVGIDIETGDVAHRFDFPRRIAPYGSYLQDLAVSSDGRWVYVADAGILAKRPALIVYDSETQSARRLLNRHESLHPRNLLIRNQIRDMSYLGGLVEMRVGLDGLALSRDNAWLFYGAMNHDTLFKVPTAALQNPGLPPEMLAVEIEVAGRKPLSDGIAIDGAGTVYITDVENQAVHALDTESGLLTTLVKDSRIRWADGLSFGPEGWLYVADSALPELVMQPPENVAAKAPYTIWRFRPGDAAEAAAE